MLQWYEDGYLDDSLEVRSASASTYAPLSTLVAPGGAFGKAARHWYYIDEKEEEQGPFEEEELLGLYYDGYLPGELRARPSDEAEYQYISVLVAAGGALYQRLQLLL